MKPNIILITVDALRADHLGFMGYPQNISPNIDELARESTVFESAFAAGPGTPYSFPSILTSTYPLDYHGPRKIAEPRIMLSQVLREQGYLTAAFHSSVYLSDFFGYNQGWDYFNEIFPPLKNLVLSKEKGISRKKTSFFTKLKRFFVKFFLKLSLNSFPVLFFLADYLNFKIKSFSQKNASVSSASSSLSQIAKDFIRSRNSGEQFFFWIHYMDVHAYDDRPRDKSINFQEFLGKKLPVLAADYYFSSSVFFKKFCQKYLKLSLSLYDEAIRKTDEKIGRLLTVLKQKGFYENSIICLASDHGEEFLEHQGADHITDKLYNELLKVPLLIKVPGKNSEVVKEKVSLIDLAPTLLSLAGVNPPPSFKGKNIFGNSRQTLFHQSGWAEGKIEKWVEVSKIAECKVACQTEDWKYILDHGDNKEEIYNLKKDPGEQVNLAQKEPEMLLKMRQIVQEFEKENPPLSLLKVNSSGVF